MPHYDGSFFGMHFLWWILWIGIIVAGIIFLNNTQKKSNTSSEETALDILKKRYARGEITKEEFERSKKTLDE